MAWKHHDALTIEECRSEMYHLEDYFRMCREEGHGISSKESIRHRAVKARVEAADRGIPESAYADRGILRFIRDHHIMFAEVNCDCYHCRDYRKAQADPEYAKIRERLDRQDEERRQEALARSAR